MTGLSATVPRTDVRHDGSHSIIESAGMLPESSPGFPANLKIGPAVRISVYPRRCSVYKDIL